MSSYFDSHHTPWLAGKGGKDPEVYAEFEESDAVKVPTKTLHEIGDNIESQVEGLGLSPERTEKIVQAVDNALEHVENVSVTEIQEVIENAIEENVHGELSDTRVHEMVKKAVEKAVKTSHVRHKKPSTPYQESMHRVYLQKKGKIKELKKALNESNPLLDDHKIANGIPKGLLSAISEMERAIKKTVREKDLEFKETHDTQYKEMDKFYEKPWADRQGKRPPHPDLKKDRIKNKRELRVHMPDIEEIYNQVNQAFMDPGPVSKRIRMPPLLHNSHNTGYFPKPALIFLGRLKFVLVQCILNSMKIKNSPNKEKCWNLSSRIRGFKTEIRNIQKEMNDMRKKHIQENPDIPSRPHWNFNDKEELMQLRYSNKAHHEGPLEDTGAHPRTTRPGGNPRGGGQAARGRGRGRG